MRFFVKDLSTYFLCRFLTTDWVEIVAGWTWMRKSKCRGRRSSSRLLSRINPRMFCSKSCRTFANCQVPKTTQTALSAQCPVARFSRTIPTQMKKTTLRLPRTTIETASYRSKWVPTWASRAPTSPCNRTRNSPTRRTWRESIGMSRPSQVRSRGSEPRELAVGPLMTTSPTIT